MKLEIANVGNFAHKVVEFSQISMIVGDNGAGKSTLVRAVFYALCGDSGGGNSKSLIKQGTKKAQITLHLVNGTIQKIITEHKNETIYTKGSTVLEGAEAIAEINKDYGHYIHAFIREQSASVLRLTPKECQHLFERIVFKEAEELLVTLKEKRSESDGILANKKANLLAAENLVFTQLIVPQQVVTNEAYADAVGLLEKDNAKKTEFANTFKMLQGQMSGVDAVLDRGLRFKEKRDTLQTSLDKTVASIKDTESEVHTVDVEAKTRLSSQLTALEQEVYLFLAGVDGLHVDSTFTERVIPQAMQDVEREVQDAERICAEIDAKISTLRVCISDFDSTKVCGTVCSKCGNDITQDIIKGNQMYVAELQAEVAQKQEALNHVSETAERWRGIRDIVQRHERSYTDLLRQIKERALSDEQARNTWNTKLEMLRATKQDTEEDIRKIDTAIDTLYTTYAPLYSIVLPLPYSIEALSSTYGPLYTTGGATGTDPSAVVYDKGRLRIAIEETEKTAAHWTEVVARATGTKSQYDGWRSSADIIIKENDSITTRAENNRLVIESLRAEITERDKGLRVIQDAITAVGQGFVPYLVQDFLSSVRGFVNKVLKEVYSKYVFDVSTSVKGVHFYLRNAAGSLDIKVCSGFEKSLVNALLAIAIARHQGVDMVALDEADAQASEENSFKFLSVIVRLLRQQGIKHAFMITHRKDVVEQLLLVDSKIQLVEV